MATMRFCADLSLVLLVCCRAGALPAGCGDCPRSRGRRPAGGCSTISRSIIARRSRRPRRSTRSNMTRWSNSRPRSRPALAALPAKPQRAGLVARRRRRSQRGDRRQGRAAGDRRRRPRRSPAALLAAYPVPLAPAAAPDLARGAALYARELRLVPRRQGRGAERRASPSSTRRRSPSPTATAPASAACSASTR